MTLILDARKLVTGIHIHRPDDFHAHLRQGDLLKTVCREHNVYNRVLLMPNLIPPVWNAQTLTQYRDEIQRSEFKAEPLYTVKLLDRTTPPVIHAAHAAGAVAAKLYPAGVTTNSDDGITNPKLIWEVFGAMEQIGMLLLIHAEFPGTFVLDRESHYLPIVRDIAREFPQLRIVVEHLSTAAGVHWVETLPENVAATITAHHLILTLDDVVGGELKPHNFCKPLAKRPDDRYALIRAATSGNPKFFFGSDSAPHPISKKECSSCSAGVYMPGRIALPLLAEVFERERALDRLDAFTSRNGARFYKLPLTTDTITLEKTTWTVPPPENGAPRYFGVGQKLTWQVVDQDDYARPI